MVGMQGEGAHCLGMSLLALANLNQPLYLASSGASVVAGLLLLALLLRSEKQDKRGMRLNRGPTHLRLQLTNY